MSNTEALRAALSALLDRYTGLVNCGDCGNWNPEEEAPVIAARAALAQPAETDAELQHRTGEPHIDGWPLYSGLPPAASGEPPEPFGYVITHNFPEGHAYRYSFYTPKSIGTAYRDTALSITPVFANAQPAPAPAELVEMSPEFTDTARAALLWVLWHHQGGSSPVGQPLRFALGMDAHAPLEPHQIKEAKRWAALTNSTTAEFRAAPQPAPGLQFDARGVLVPIEPDPWVRLFPDW